MNQPAPITPPLQKSDSSKPAPVVIVILFLLVVACLGAASYQYKQSSSLKKSLDQKVASLDKRLAVLETPTKYVQEQVDKDKLQAVFLVSGQVYFGKITHIDATSLTLTEIFYLKDGSFQKDGTLSGTNVSLVKLGKELHGPEDKMVVERKNVSFWENLKTDGEVTKAITDYQKAH